MGKALESLFPVVTLTLSASISRSSAQPISDAEYGVLTIFSGGLIARQHSVLGAGCRNSTPAMVPTP